MGIHKPIKIIAFTSKGKRIKTFKSIHAFRKATKIHRLSANALKLIHEGQIAYFSKYLLGLAKKFSNHKTINPLECKLIKDRSNAKRRKNVFSLNRFHDKNRLIVLINNNLEILGSTNKTIKELSKIEKISEGTIKSSLHRSARRFKNSNLNGRHYIYLKDIPSFVKHATKALCFK